MGQDLPSRFPSTRFEFDQAAVAVGIPVPFLSLPVSITALPPIGAEASQPTDFNYGSVQ